MSSAVPASPYVRELSEIVGRAAAASDPVDEGNHLVEGYLQLSTTDRVAFARVLAEESARADEQAVAEARRVLGTTGAHARAARAALEPGYLRLLRRLGAVAGGPAVAVGLRGDLRACGGGDAAAAALEHELGDLLRAWFEPSSFELRRVTWDAPASLLERLASLEAVHAVRGWDDLKNRVDADRRVYALFHPLLDDTPVAFTQIATTRGLASSIDELLDDSAPTADPERADTAVFYSISAVQPGMSGLAVGATLIDRAIVQLQKELPAVRTFATLSPMPGFVSWLQEERGVGETQGLLDAVTAGEGNSRTPLLRLAARYLLSAGRGGKARDPVANFHLSNGARIERLNWLADRSESGLRASAGVMVNYLYPLRDRARNRLRYVDEGKVAASGPVTRLAADRPTGGG